MLCRKSDQLSKQPRGRGDSSWTRGLHDPVSALSEAEPLPLTLEGSAGESQRCCHERAGAGELQPARGCPAPGGHGRHRARAGLKGGLQQQHKGQPVEGKARSSCVQQHRAAVLMDTK